MAMVNRFFLCMSGTEKNPFFSGLYAWIQVYFYFGLLLPRVSRRLHDQWNQDRNSWFVNLPLVRNVRRLKEVHYAVI